MEDDLSVLEVSSSDRRKLEAMGLRTLEQLVLFDRHSLGMGKERGDALIQRAANVLVNMHLRQISVEESGVTVRLDRDDMALITALKDVLGSYGVTYETAGPGIVQITKPATDDGFSYGYLVERARRWEAIVAAREAATTQALGITLARDELIRFAQERGFEGFAEGVFAELAGNVVMKRALASALFSTFHEPVHVLVIGEPGSGKTMAMDTIVKYFGGVVPVGANTTRAGLVCDRSTGELGVLASAGQQVVVIDEFDKVPRADVRYCYELLSNGKCRVDSGRIHQTIESQFIAIAFANPKGDTFRGNAVGQIAFPPTLLSRFALIVRSETLTQLEVRDLMRQRLFGDSEVAHAPEYFDQWVRLARGYEPKVAAGTESVDEYLDEASALYERYSRSALRRDHRLADYVARLPRSIARSEFSDVTDNALGRALALLKESIEAWE